MLDGPIM